jgi:triacylglycerol lipase
MMRNTILILTLLFLAPAHVYAQKTPECQYDGPNAGNCGPPPFAADGETSSPIAPLKPNDTRFIVNGGEGLDTVCTFRPEGPLVITLPVKRVVGKTNSDGTLQDVGGMLQTGVISSKARLRLPVFDVDLAGAPGLPPEIDFILFNGVVIGSLSGSNNTWKLNEFEVPIDLVRFGTRNASGEPTPGNNEIKILIDQASGSDINWCTAVDWVEMTFKAVSPVILVHGNGQKGKFYKDTGFESYLESQHILFDHSIDLRRFPIYTNAGRIDQQLPDIVKSFGVDSIHLVAHSKGGIDSRAYLAVYQHSHDNEFKVLSLNTLSSPHDGTILTDVLQARKEAVEMIGKLGRIEYINFPDWTRQMVFFVTFDEGLQSLTTNNIAIFNRENLPALPPNLSITAVGADADKNENGQIDRNPDEYAGMRLFNFFLRNSDPVSSAPGRFAMDSVYQILRNTDHVELECCRTETVLGVPRKIATIRAAPSAIVIPNDILVTGASAIGARSIEPRSFRNLLYLAGAGRDHGTIADAGVAAQVVVWILAIERTSGDLK